MKNGIGRRMRGTIVIGIACLMAVCGLVKEAQAASAREIDTSVNVTLERFYSEVTDGKQLVKDAKGSLIFPAVYKAGFGLGGEYGEGALLIDGKTVDYYSTAAGSFGFQIGAQKKSIIILFMQDEALRKFRESEGWKAGVDGSVALVDMGLGKELSSQTLQNPIVGFVFGQKGLMYNLTLEGTKITKLNKN